MGRRGYTTLFKPFRNSDIQVKIRWFTVPPENGTLPFPSGITSLDWATFPEKHTGVGEVFGASRNFRPRVWCPEADGHHVCGTSEEHLRGELLDVSRPRTEYTEGGVPKCCIGDRIFALLPLLLAVESEAVVSNPTRTEIPFPLDVVASVNVSNPTRTEIPFPLDVVASSGGYSCETAVVASEGVEAVAEMGPTGEVWFTFDVPTRRRVDVFATLDPLPGGGESFVYFGACGDLIEVYFTAASQLLDTGNEYVSATYFVVIRNPDALGFTARMRFDFA